MHTRDYIRLEIRISDFECKLIAIHVEFNEVCQILYELKQENNKDVGISYVVTNITNPNHLTPTILSFSTLELPMWLVHHGRTTEQKSSTCPKPKPWSQEITINTLVFKDADQKFNPKSPTTLDRDDKKLVRFRPTCGLGSKGACKNDHSHLNNIQMLNGSILDMHVQVQSKVMLDILFGTKVHNEKFIDTPICEFGFQVHSQTFINTKLLQLELVHNNSIIFTPPIDTQKIDFWSGW